MPVLKLAKFGLFLAFPLVCFLVRENQEAHNAVVKAAPYVRMSLEYIMIYLFAFRGVNLYPGWMPKVKATIKYFIAAACMVIIKNILALSTMNEVQQFFMSDKLCKAFGVPELIEIGGSYILMNLGYAKLSKIPFFLTAHLWVIYYVNSYIFHQEVVDNYSRFKNGFEIVHDAMVGSMHKFVKTTHEPPMALALAGILTFNLEIELLLVSIANHLLAIIVGYWTISNHTHPYIQLITKHLSPYIKFNTSKLQSDVAFFFICVILSIQVHYWWTLSKILSKYTGRRNTFAVDPWTVRKVRNWSDKVHDIYDYVLDGVYHAYDEVAGASAKAYETGKHGAEVAYKAGKEGAAHAYEITKDGASKVYQEAAKKVSKKK